MHQEPIISSREQHTPALSLSDLEYYAMGWGLDGDAQMLARSYVAKRKDTTSKLLWFLKAREYDRCGAQELRAFFAYLRTSHEAPGGRWGNERQRKALTPATVGMWHKMLRAFFNYVVADGGLDSSPMARIAAPIARPDQVRPFSEAQQRALIEAARRSRYHVRNVALLLFMLDTGARASEVCAVTFGDLSLSERSCRIRGKGDKERTVCFGTATTQALFAHLRLHSREPGSPLFIAIGGTRPGEALTRFGLKQLLAEWGEAAGITGVRCSPHTCRHTMAVGWLLSGGDQYTLQILLGHSNPSMTSRYVNLARADLQAQHRRVSPLDKLLQKGGHR